MNEIVKLEIPYETAALLVRFLVDVPFPEGEFWTTSRRLLVTEPMLNISNQVRAIAEKRIEKAALDRA